MNKSDLIEQLASRANITLTAADKIINEIFDGMAWFHHLSRDNNGGTPAELLAPSGSGVSSTANCTLVD